MSAIKKTILISIKSPIMLICTLVYLPFMVACSTVSNKPQELEKIKLQMVKIPGGTFRLFDSIQRPPPMNQTVSSFYISQYEVTQEDYSIITGVISENFQGMLKPVSASWYEALVFCNLLSIKEGRDPAYQIKGSTDPTDWGMIPSPGLLNDKNWDSVIVDWSKNGYRLPTDMEWRWAALGGQDIPKKEFAGDPNPNTLGDDHSEYAWIDTHKLGEGNPDYGPHQVGSKKPNEFNLYDMTGNMSEWVWDWSTSNGYYLNDENNYRGPANPGVGTTRFSKLVRGSDWTRQYTNSYAFAVADFPALKQMNYGFRVAYYNY